MCVSDVEKLNKIKISFNAECRRERIDQMQSTTLEHHISQRCGSGVYLHTIIHTFNNKRLLRTLSIVYCAIKHRQHDSNQLPTPHHFYIYET